MESDQLKKEEHLVREISYPLFSSKGWIKFLGYLMLIYGIFIALTIVGLIIAWLPIWLGILLIQTASRLEKAQAIGNRESIVQALQNLSTYFTIYGVLAVIGIILSIVFTAVFLATGMLTELYEYAPDYY